MQKRRCTGIRAVLEICYWQRETVLEAMGIETELGSGLVLIRWYWHHGPVHLMYPMKDACRLAMGEGARITAQAQGHSTRLTLQISVSSLGNGDNNDTWLAQCCWEDFK